MEDAIYYGTIAAVIAFGLYGGKRLARSRGEAVLIGLGGTTVAVVAFLCLIVVFSIVAPDSLDSRGIGVRLGASAALRIGARGGFGDRRPAPRRESRRTAVLTDEIGRLPETERSGRLQGAGVNFDSLNLTQRCAHRAVCSVVYL